MGTAAGWADALAGGDRIDAPVALVVAHADDETLWAGTALARLTRLLLIHATDSSPADPADAHRRGLSGRGAYAALRARELDAALVALEVAPRRRAYGIVDQGLVDALPALVDRLADDLADVAAVITHPYEGGHPDHDALAWAVAAAARRIAARQGRGPAVVEFACYHEVEGERRFGRFRPDPACPERTRAIAPVDAERLDRAIRAHASQADVVAGWRPTHERWRAAPAYDFAAPPPPGRALYDRFGWAMTSARWRRLVAAASADAQGAAWA